MEKQETIKEETQAEHFVSCFTKQALLTINFLWKVLNLFVTISVIGLLYMQGLTGASMFLYNFLRFWLVVTVVLLFAIGYFNLIKSLLVKTRQRQLIKREILKQELKQEILRDLKHSGKRK